MLICDLHVHTDVSRDGESSVEEILKRAEEAGLDAIAITDHDSTDGAKRAMACKSDVIVIPGIEVSTKQGHLIVLGVTEVIPSGLDVGETIAIAHDLGAVLILPHPFHLWRHGVARKRRAPMLLVDAVEVFNSRYIVGSANGKAARMAKRLGKPCVGGSDAHNAKFVGFGRTFVDAEPNVTAILQAIREGKVSCGGRKTPIRTYTRQSLRSTWRRIKRFTRKIQLK
ncbi:MAG TPA: PHP domain-containing protein [Methanoregulaceae archaeon]|nr:PHP domain-containing protein [Methanoregulaceae archaeon]HPD76202.1 PHP domain-containing protein [Methanoregulaceae archaeon]HRY76191.1 PHP domain-containing protein [Methanoregulaceae archaeon]